MSSNYQFLASFTLGASGTQTVDIDCRDLKDFQIFFKREYQATGSVTDVKLTMKEGNGPYGSNAVDYEFVKVGGFSVPVYETTGEDKTAEISAVTANSGSPVTAVDVIDVIMEEVGRFIRLELLNRDSHSVVVTLTADI
jgi:hypothetical protein